MLLIPGPLQMQTLLHCSDSGLTLEIINVKKNGLALSKGTKRNHVLKWMVRDASDSWLERQLRIHCHLFSCSKRKAPTCTRPCMPHSEIMLHLPWRHLQQWWAHSVRMAANTYRFRNHCVSNYALGILLAPLQVFSPTSSMFCGAKYIWSVWWKQRDSHDGDLRKVCEL